MLINYYVEVEKKSVLLGKLFEDLSLTTLMRIKILQVGTYLYNIIQ